MVPLLQLSQSDMRAVAEICCRLDGIPLAIELAATRVSALSLEQIASRLDRALALLTGGSRTAADRQQTVRATLGWSYQLLSASEQLLLDRLSVFAGGWTLDAAEEIVSVDDLERVALPPTFSQLVDKSLVQVERHADGSARYRVLETVRQYALERLEVRGDTVYMRDRHAEYFVRLVERSERALTGHGHLEAQARLDRQQDNCRAALRQLVHRGDAEAARRLAGGVGRFWFFRGYLAEGEAWFERVLALPDTGQPTIGRARCIYGLGRLALSRADYGL